jgi:hypothetical protein
VCKIPLSGGGAHHRRGGFISGIIKDKIRVSLITYSECLSFILIYDLFALLNF